MGSYDSWYLRAVHPYEQIGVWIRHTYRESEASGVRGAHWFTLFTPQGIVAQKASFPGKPAVAADRFAGEAGSFRWDLSVECLAPSFEHLPAHFMYSLPWPRTKPISVCPLAEINGEIAVGGRSIAVCGWRGMVGHNWGAEHAHCWIWIHAAGFDGEPDSWLDVTLAKLRVGSVITPWLGNGAIHLAGERHRLGGLFRRATVEADVEGAAIGLSGKDVAVRINVSSPDPAATVVWRYCGPDGAEHFVSNCSIAVSRSASPAKPAQRC